MSKLVPPEWEHPQLKLRERFWLLQPGEWMGPPDWPWWRRWAISITDDERAYRTLILPLPFWGHLVIAFRRCYEQECMDAAREYEESQEFYEIWGSYPE